MGVGLVYEEPELWRGSSGVKHGANSPICLARLESGAAAGRGAERVPSTSH